MNALKLLTNQQTGGDSVEVLAEVLLEPRRLKMLEDLRRFVMTNDEVVEDQRPGEQLWNRSQ